MPSKREQLLEIMEEAAKGETKATLRARIAELEAEAGRLTKERDYWQSQHDERTRQLGQSDAEALSRTGAVKVKALGDWRRGYCDDEVTIEQVSTGFGSIYQVRIFEGTIWLDYPVREKEAFPTVEAAKAAAQADFERRILSALEPSAPEGLQEPVAWGVFYRGKIVAVSLHKGYHYTVPLYTRPSEQAVTEAMVEAVVQAVRPYTMRTLFIDEHRELVRAALKDAMEAGR